MSYIIRPSYALTLGIFPPGPDGMGKILKIGAILYYKEKCRSWYVCRNQEAPGLGDSDSALSCLCMG